VIDRNNIVLDKSFFSSPIKDVTESIYYKCSVEGWLSDIFVKSEKEDWKGLMNN
jgi:hypothetical protein